MYVDNAFSLSLYVYVYIDIRYAYIRIYVYMYICYVYMCICIYVYVYTRVVYGNNMEKQTQASQLGLTVERFIYEGFMGFLP